MKASNLDMSPQACGHVPLPALLLCESCFISLVFHQLVFSMSYYFTGVLGEYIKISMICKILSSSPLPYLSSLWTQSCSMLCQRAAEKKKEYIEDPYSFHFFSEVILLIHSRKYSGETQ